MQSAQLVSSETLSLLKSEPLAPTRLNKADALKPAKPTSPEAISLRRGLFVAASRTYGESYIEPIIRQLMKLDKPVGGDYDGHDPKTHQRYEIKSAKALAPNPASKRAKKGEPKSLFTEIETQAKAVPLSRVISFADRKSAKYDANIQNVKRDHFDHLIFVVLYEEGVEIFQAPVKRINREHIVNWSDKHGRYDELGKSGQFNISAKSIDAHERNSFSRFLTYEELVPVAKGISL